MVSKNVGCSTRVVRSDRYASRFDKSGAAQLGGATTALSKIYFLPTHSLELTEAAALREAMNRGIVEDRIPYIRSFDVLIQYMITLAVSDGFKNEVLFNEIKSTHCFSSVTEEEWNWLLNFITSGGAALTAYDEYRKVILENGIFK